MSKKINKINKLKKLEGFLQLNYSKGFKYVDRAGEFFNNFYSDGHFPLHAMDPTGMTVKINEKVQLKTSPYHLWMRFVEPDSFDYQLQSFMKKADLINSIFEPEKYTRIGWRSYFIYECGDSYPNIIPNGFLSDSEFNEIVFTKKIEDFDLRISVSKMIKGESQTKAILFDIDMFLKEDIDKENFNKVSIILTNMERVYKSDDLLNSVNNLLI
jgi:hypothetical protein